MISVHAHESIASVIRSDAKYFVIMMVCASTRDRRHTHWLRLADYDRNMFAEPTDAKKACEKLLSIGALTKMDTPFRGFVESREKSPWRNDDSRYAPTQLGVDALRLVYSTMA